MVSNTNEFTETALGRLPLDAWHRARAARMVPFAGWDMPVLYEGEGGGILAEHRWTRAHAGLFDVSHMGQLVVSGDGAEAALEALIPADLGALKLGGLRYSLLLNAAGGIIDDIIVARWPNSFFIVVNGACVEGDLAHLRAHLPAAVTIEHRAAHALLALQGPAAVAVLAGLNLTPAMPQIVPVEQLGFMQMGPYLWGDIPLGISRSGYTGEDGFEISCRAEHAEVLADALTAHPETRAIGLGARDSLRLEAGLPLYGHDLTTETDPVSAGLSFAINKRRRAEGGFPGAAQILSALAYGTPDRRVGLAIEGRQAAREGAEIFAGEQCVGHVTSGGFAPSLDHAIAMGFVWVAHAAPGTALTIEVRGRHLPAKVAPLPFVPHRYHR